MSSRIEDYALIGDCQTAALVDRNGSIDWLCFPRFDSPACFAALLGTRDSGNWELAPTGRVREVRRRYRGETLVLETTFETDEGSVAVIDFMPPRTSEPDLVRMVVGRRGRVPMRMDLGIRLDYGATVPWVRSRDDEITAVAGPDALRIISPVPVEGKHYRSMAEFTVSEGDRLPFIMTWYRSHDEVPSRPDAEDLLEHTERWWKDWAGKCRMEGPWRDPVVRSLITLKALTYSPTGGLVAAPTTSLPEKIGGVRNWDYRYCWLRDATYTLFALVDGGYLDEAQAWRDWLIRAIAGKPSQIQPLYGLAGERLIPEWEIDWLAGYEGSLPVRVGNAAHRQLQLDVYGEIMDMLHCARSAGLPSDENAAAVQIELLEHLESEWNQADAGIWEIRDRPRHFTHSRVMSWVAFDRAVKAVERSDLDGPIHRWRSLRDEIHGEICEKGYDRERNSFVRSYGSKKVDASLLVLPAVGFLPPDDPRLKGTVAAVEEDLTENGFVHRYRSEAGADGLPEGEGAFLLCTFWLADAYALTGRTDEARQLFERLLELSNDVGLYPEEYDPGENRFLGNFPQAFSHVALINTARNLEHGGPAERRAGVCR